MSCLTEKSCLPQRGVRRPPPQLPPVPQGRSQRLLDMSGPGFRMSGYLWLEANWPGSDRVIYENRKGHAFRMKYGRTKARVGYMPARERRSAGVGGCCGL